MFLKKKQNQIQRFFSEKKKRSRLLVAFSVVLFAIFPILILVIKRNQSRELIKPRTTTSRHPRQDEQVNPQQQTNSHRDQETDLEQSPDDDNKKTLPTPLSQIQNKAEQPQELPITQTLDNRTQQSIWPQVSIKEPQPEAEFYYGIDFKVKIDVGRYHQVKQVRYYLDDSQVFEIQDLATQSDQDHPDNNNEQSNPGINSNSNPSINSITHHGGTLSLETIFDSSEMLGFPNEAINLDFYVNLITQDDFVVQSEKIPVKIKPNHLTIEGLEAGQEFFPQEKFDVKVVFDDADLIQKVDFFINEKVYLISDETSPFELNFDLQKLYAAVSEETKDTLNIQVHDNDENIQTIKDVDFVIVPPQVTIDVIQPKIASFGDLLTFEGQGFGVEPARLYFYEDNQLHEDNTKALSLVEWTDSKIRVYLNDKIQAGQFQVQVVNQYQQESSLQDLTIDYGQAKISTIDFMRDEEQVYLNVLGQYFADEKGIVYFLDSDQELLAKAEIREWKNSSIMCDIPEGLESNATYYVYLETADQRSSPAIKLTLD